MFLGIDPGLSGGIAWTDGSCEGSGAVVMPILSGRPDLNALGEIIAAQKPGHVFIEQAWPRPGEGATGAYTQGANWGLIVGWLEARAIPYTIVSPQAWKKSMGVTAPSKSTPKEKKELSIAAALRLFPTVDLKASDKCRTYHDGIAEALLIAEYGRREVGR